MWASHFVDRLHTIRGTFTPDDIDPVFFRRIEGVVTDLARQSATIVVYAISVVARVVAHSRPPQSALLTAPRHNS
jgi:hypothetical protein